MPSPLPVTGDTMSDDQADLKVYIGFIWIDDQPGIRFQVEAHSLEEARGLVVEEYGEGVISMRNEDDASSAR